MFQYAITFVITSIFAYLMSIYSIDIRSIFYLVVAAISMWIPGLVALFSSLHKQQDIKVFTKGSFPVYLVSVLLALFIFFIQVPVFHLVGLMQNFKSYSILLLLFKGFSISFIPAIVWLLPFTLILTTFFALGEELLWSGYLYNKYKGLGFFRSSYLIGLLWGMWHLPLLVVGYHHTGHVVLLSCAMVLVCLLLRPILVLMRQKSGSIIPVAFFHGCLDVVTILPIFFIYHNDPLILELLAILAIGVLGAVNLSLVIFNFLKNRSLTKMGKPN